MVDDVPLPEPGRQTPYRIFRPAHARARFDALAALRDALSTPSLELVAALSVKTNPRSELMALARGRGLFAEVISDGELRWARACGFGTDRTIYNGPLPPQAADGAAIVFADSVEAFRRPVARATGSVYGVRLRPSMLDSRFGVPVAEDDALSEAIAATPERSTIAVSFHARREDFGRASWRDVAADVVQRAAVLQSRCARPVVAFDAGGGWTPAEFDETFEPDMRWLTGRLAAMLPACARLIAEPGQALSMPAEALIATIVEVRERAARHEVVIDAGYPDWPQMHAYPHPIFAAPAGRWVSVGTGADVLHGRTCLEYDRIDGLRFPAGIAGKQYVLIADVGAYDRSTSFDFACGSVPNTMQSE